MHRNLARSFVLLTRKLPPFSYLYRWGYRLAAWFLVHRVGDSRLLCSVLSRNSYADDTFDPGVSDVDTVFIYRDGVPVSILWESIERFESRFRRWKRIFPMLDHPGIYTEQDFLLSWRLGVIRRETYAWRCEYGRDLPNEEESGAAEGPTQAYQYVDEAIEVFLTLFHTNYKAFLANSQSAEESLRVSHKITGYLRRVQEDIDFVESRDPNVILSLTLSQLEAVNSAVTAAESFPAHEFPLVDDVTGDAVFPPAERDSPTVPAAVGCIVRGPPTAGSPFVLLRSPTPESIPAVVNFVQRRLPGEAPRPVFISESLWPSMLRRVRPLLYYRLQRERTVFVGEDPLVGLPAPTAESLRAFFRQEASGLLRAPLSLWVAGRGKDSQGRGQLLKQMARRVVRLRGFLEQGVVVLNVGRYLATLDEESVERELIRAEDSGLGDEPYRVFEGMLRLRNVLQECLKRHGEALR